MDWSFVAIARWITGTMLPDWNTDMQHMWHVTFIFHTNSLINTEKPSVFYFITTEKLKRIYKRITILKPYLGVTFGDVIAQKNNWKLIVIGKIIGPGKIDSFTSIESILALISFFNYRKSTALRLNFWFKLNYFSASIFWEMA